MVLIEECKRIEQGEEAKIQTFVRISYL